MMGRAKRIYVLIIKVNKLFFFFAAVFSKRNRKHVTRVYIELYTRGSLGELEKAVETLTRDLCSHSISRSPKLPRVFLLIKQLDYELEISI